MRIVSAVVVVPSLFALLAACSSAGPVSEPSSESSSALGGEAAQHVQWQKGARHGGGGGGSSLLIDHGGTVLPTSNVYTIWWGPSSGWASDVSGAITSMFDGFDRTNFLGIAQQYMRGAGISTNYVGSYSDTSSSPPTRSPSTSTIVSEACKVINANRLTADPTALYLVYTSNFPGGHVNFCAWHSYGTCNGQTIQVAYMPNTTGISGCDPGTAENCATSNGYSQGARSLANVSSHEYMETLTDADVSAWYDSSGSEIGDKCAWQFSSCANLSTGSWQLQEEWSNAANNGAGGCVQN